MNQEQRSHLSFYRQIFNFSHMVAHYTHSSWLENIPVPTKIESNKTQKDLYLSQQLSSGIPPLSFSQSSGFSPLLFVCTLAPGKLKRFMTYFTLSLLKNDKSLLINGAKLKAFSLFLTQDQMDFLLLEKDVKLKLPEHSKFQLTENISEPWFESLGFYALGLFLLKDDDYLKDRFRYRFSRETVLNAQKSFHFSLETESNRRCISIICEVLFPSTFSVFEKEFALMNEGKNFESSDAFPIKPIGN